MRRLQAFWGLRSCATILGVSLAPWGALAQQPKPPVHVSWQAPPECPSSSELVQMVEGFLGQPLDATRPQSLELSAVVRTLADGAHSAALTLATATGASERTLQHDDCRKLTEATALVMALTIDPSLVEAAAQARESAAPSTPPVETPPASEEADPPSTAPPVVDAPSPASMAAKPNDSAPARSRGSQEASAPQFWAGLNGVTGAGTVPGFALAAGGQLAVDWPRLRIAVAPRYWLPREAPVRNVPAAAVSIQLTSVGLRGCPLARVGGFTLAPCAGFDLGDMRGEGAGEAVAPTGTRHALWSAAAVGLEVAYAQSTVRPVVGVEGAYTLERPRFGVVRDGAQLEVFRPDRWVGQAYVGLAARL
jgi:hypothetical protein